MKKTTRNIVLVSACILSAFLFNACTKTDLSNPANPTSKDYVAHSNLRLASCTNPYEWVGSNHNVALSTAMSITPLPTSSEGVLSRAKSSVLALTNYPDARATINAYANASLIASERLTAALMQKDDNVILQYCSADEATLLKQLFVIAGQSKSVSSVIDEINAWACDIMNDATLTSDLKNKMLVTSTVMTNSMTYWTTVYGDTTPEARCGWFGGDAVGALIGFSIGGPWGSLIGAVAGSVAVGCFGAEVYSN